MGKRINSVIAGLLGNGSGPSPCTLTDTERRAKLALNREKAYAAMRGGLKVFMSKETCDGFEKLLHTKPTTQLMRRVLEEIACGTLVLSAPGQATTVTHAPTPRAQANAVPTVLSVDQLIGGMPLTLKQAAKVLNVRPQMLYFRCVTGRIHFQRERSRYYIPATEVQRLQVIGLS